VHFNDFMANMKGTVKRSKTLAFYRERFEVAEDA
jgi:hypothetical protein